MYSITQAYKDVEKILQRPLNSGEFMNIEIWFQRYEADHIEACIKMCRGMNIYKASYISNVLASHHSYYQTYQTLCEYEKFENIHSPVDVRQKTEEDLELKEALKLADSWEEE